jgi:CBS domain-containing protein
VRPSLGLARPVLILSDKRWCAMSLERFCRKNLICLKPDDPVRLAAELMAEHHVGAVVVVNDEGRPLGVVTDRDLTCRIIAQRKDPARTLAREVMSASAAVIQRSALLEDALVQMRQSGTRRLPIVDGTGAAVGIVTLDDLLVLLIAELGQTTAVIRQNKGP